MVIAYDIIEQNRQELEKKVGPPQEAAKNEIKAIKCFMTLLNTFPYNSEKEGKKYGI